MTQCPGWVTGNGAKVRAQLGRVEEQLNEPGSSRIAWNSDPLALVPGPQLGVRGEDGRKLTVDLLRLVN